MSDEEKIDDTEKEEGDGEDTEEKDPEEGEDSNLSALSSTIKKYKDFLTRIKEEYIVIKESEYATEIFDNLIALLDELDEVQSVAFEHFFNDVNTGHPLGDGINLIKGNSYSDYIEEEYKYRDVRQLIWDNLRKFLEDWTLKVIKKLDELIPPIEDAIKKIQEEYNKFKEEWDRKKNEDSGSLNDTIGETYTAPSGRKYTRHIRDIGTVMEFNDGQDRRVLILDAKYRTMGLAFGSHGKDSQLPNYNYPEDNFTMIFNNLPDADPVPDNYINERFPFKDENTARYNCDIWMGYQGTTDDSDINGVPAVEYARSVTVGGTTCDVPNIQTLIRIYCDAEFIDTLDPTVEENSGLRLGRGENSFWLSGGDPHSLPSVWASTDKSDVDVWSIQGGGGAVQRKSKIQYGGVIPVQELALKPSSSVTGSSMVTEMTAPSGRKLFRHKSNKGTVIEFNDGQPRWVMVLDAQYRSDQDMQFGTYGKDTDLPNYSTGHIGGGSHETFYYLFDQSGGLNTNKVKTKDCATITDEWLNSHIFNDKNTAKQNCDLWMKYNSQMDNYNIRGVPAVAFCRNVYVDDQQCDLPNIQTLARIICDADALDSMDPTVGANPGKKLSTTTNYPYYDQAKDWFYHRYPTYSSTEVYTSDVWCGYNGFLTPSSKAGATKVGWNEAHTIFNGGYTAIPVLEFSSRPEGLPSNTNTSTSTGVTSATPSSGRKLYRHESNMGTVMEYYDGMPKKVLILDAKYRAPSTLKFGTFRRDAPLINAAYDSKNFAKITAGANDNWLNSNLVKDSGTSKSNCNTWMTFKGTADFTKNMTTGAATPITGVPAVEYARSIIVNGQACDIPNIQILARIFADKNDIDALDPTISSSGRGLSSWSISGSSNSGGDYANVVCSSTEISEASIYVITNNGYAISMAKSFAYSVIPVLEL